jgi:hypothetical protein
MISALGYILGYEQCPSSPLHMLGRAPSPKENSSAITEREFRGATTASTLPSALVIDNTQAI